MLVFFGLCLLITFDYVLVTGSEVPEIDLVEGGFLGGIRTKYGSFSIPRQKKSLFHIDRMADFDEKETDEEESDEKKKDEEDRDRYGSRRRGSGKVAVSSLVLSERSKDRVWNGREGVK